MRPPLPPQLVPWFCSQAVQGTEPGAQEVPSPCRVHKRGVPGFQSWCEAPGIQRNLGWGYGRGRATAASDSEPLPMRLLWASESWCSLPQSIRSPEGSTWCCCHREKAPSDQQEPPRMPTQLASSWVREGWTESSEDRPPAPFHPGPTYVALQLDPPPLEPPGRLCPWEGAFSSWSSEASLHTTQGLAGASCTLCPPASACCPQTLRLLQQSWGELPPNYNPLHNSWRGTKTQAQSMSQ